MQLPPEMYTTYILRRQGDYELLESALQNLDIAAFRKIGHQIKGNASSFGFDDLVLLGNKMHNLEEDKIQSEGQVILDEFKTWIQSKKQSYKIP